MVVKPPSGVDRGLLTELYRVFKSSHNGSWFANLQAHKKLLDKIKQKIQELGNPDITLESLEAPIKSESGKETTLDEKIQQLEELKETLGSDHQSENKQNDQDDLQLDQPDYRPEPPDFQSDTSNALTQQQGHQKDNILEHIEKIRDKAALRPDELNQPTRVLEEKKINSEKVHRLLDKVKSNIINPQGTLMETDPLYLLMAESILGSLADMNIKWSDMIEDMEYKGFKEREYPIALLEFLSKTTNRDEYGNRYSLTPEDQQMFPALSDILNQEQPTPKGPTQEPSQSPKPKFRP